MKKILWSLITILAVTAIYVFAFHPDWLVMPPKQKLALTSEKQAIQITPTPASITPEVTANPVAPTTVSTPTPVQSTPVAPMTADTTLYPCHLATPVGTKCYALDATWKMIGTIISVTDKVQVIRVYPDDNPGQPIPTPYYQFNDIYEDGE